jgi:hypothetical protein
MSGAAIPDFPPRRVDRGRESLDPVRFRRRERAAFAPIVNAIAGGLGAAPQAWVLTGDGGFGKSVLLGTLFDLSSAGPGAVTLVQCGDLGSENLPTDFIAIDAALGASVDPLDQAPSLTKLVEQQGRRYGQVTVFLDTVDLILVEHTAGPIARLIHHLLDHGASVVMTCRGHEYRALLSETARRNTSFAKRINEFDLPRLSEAEVVEWAGDFLGSLPDAPRADSRRFLQNLGDGLRKAGHLSEVCTIPLLLGLICSTFGPKGYVPEDLTRMALYEQYWNDRIARDRNHRITPAAQAQSRLCMTLGAELLRRSTDHFVDRLSAAAVDDLSTLGAADRLRSEGVLLPAANGRNRFFHQTFAEFVVARYLASEEAGSSLDNLVGRLTSGKGGHLWPVVGLLLLNIADEDELAALLGRIPLVDPFGARAQLQATLARESGQALNEVCERILRHDRHLVPAMLDILKDVPQGHLGAAQTTVTRVIRVAGAGDLQLAASAGGQLVVRSPAPERGRYLSELITAIHHRRADVTSAQRFQMYEAALGPLAVARETDALVRSTLRRHYSQIGPVGRSLAVKHHASHLSSMPANEIPEALTTFLGAELPPVKAQWPSAILRAALSAPVPDSALHGFTWRDLLVADWRKGWVDAQIHAVVAIASAGEISPADLVHEALSDGGRHKERLINVIKNLPDDQKTRLAPAILAEPSPATAAAAAVAGTVVGEVAPHLSAEGADPLRNWMMPAAALAPRRVWPVMIRLYAGNGPACAQILDDVMRANDPVVLKTVTRAILHTASAGVVEHVRDRLTVLTSTKGSAPERAKLAARLALFRPANRFLVEEQLSAGSPEPVAGACALALGTELEKTGATLAGETAAWLSELLATPHTDAAVRIAKLLSDRSRVDPASAGFPHHAIVVSARQRLLVALGSLEDGQLAAALVRLLDQGGQAKTLPQHEIEAEIEAAIDAVSRVVAAVDHSSLGAPAGFAPTRKYWVAYRATLYRAYLRLVRTASADIVPRARIRELVTDLLSRIDVEDLGDGVRPDLVSLLIALAEYDYELLDTYETRWPEVSDRTKLAIAECVLHFDRTPDGRAWRLSQRDDCPTAVAARIAKGLAPPE